MSRCAQGFDADRIAEALSKGANPDAARALELHAKDCSACARAARAWELVREASRFGSARDDRLVRPESERRLAYPSARSGVRWPGVVVAVVAAGGIGAVAGRAAGVGPGTPPAEERPATGNASPADVRSPPPRESAVDAGNRGGLTAACAAPSASPARGGSLVVLRPCEGCDRPLAVGEALGDNRAVAVPRTARLTLNLAIAEGLVDPAVSVDIDGPARVGGSESPEGPVLSVERGLAVVRAAGHPVTVRAGRSWMRSDAADWTVRVEGGHVRVSVLRGNLEVRTTTDRQDVPAGHHVDVDMGAPPPRAAWTAPRAARDEQVELGLAERELARGEVSKAQARLRGLLDSADESIAGDAAFFLARSSREPLARGQVLAHYLAKPRPTPYREQALLERARALLEAGDVGGAESIARGLAAEPELPAVVREGLRDFQRRNGQQH